MKEKIFAFNDNDGENIYRSIKEFTKELYERRREDYIEGGIQATGIIRDNVGGFKINEEYGFEPHAFSEINLNRHLQNNFNYLSKDELVDSELSYNDRIDVYNQLRIRITCGMNNLTVFCDIDGALNKFQLESLYILANFFSFLKNKGINADFRIYAGYIKINFGRNINDVISILKRKLAYAIKNENEMVRK